MPDGRGDERGSKSAAAWKAWLDEIIRTGRVVDVTQQEMREGLGGFLITGAPGRAERKKVGRAGRAGRRGVRVRCPRRPEEIDGRKPDGQ